MYLRNYVKLLFILTLSTCVWLFIYSAYATLAGRGMEKVFQNTDKHYAIETAKARNALTELSFSEFERRSLVNLYWWNIVLQDMCYLSEDKKNTSEENEKIALYNEICKTNWIPETTVRKEVEDIYKKWAKMNEETNKIKDEINSRIYADNSGKWKLDKEIINNITIVAWVWVILSIMLLFIFTRIPKEDRKESKSRSKKDE